MESVPLPPALLDRWNLGSRVRSVGQITGGELKDVYRIQADGEARPLCLRLYPPDVNVEMVASELAWVDEFARHLPQVPASIPTADSGASCVAHAGRVAVLTVFIEGNHPDRALAEHRQAAARMLALLHEAARRIREPHARNGFPAWRDLDWWRNRWWNWEDLHQFLTEFLPGRVRGLGTAGLQRRLLAGVEQLQDLFGRLADADLPEIPIQNDYFEGNLLEREGDIVGVVDWDETALDWRACELANAAWSFSRTGDHRLDVRMARAFLAEYQVAGGEITDDELLHLIPLMRARHLWETLYELGRACRGAPVDWDYLVGNLTALDGLDLERL